MINLLFGTFFFMVPLTFVLSFVLPDIVNVVTVPMGLFFSAIVFIADCVRKKLFTRAQVFKMFLNSLLLMKFFILYEMKTCLYVTSGLALIFVFIILIVLADQFDTMVNESLRINKKS